MNDKIGISNKPSSFNIYNENALMKLDNKVADMQKSNQIRISAYQKKINQKIENNDKKYQKKLVKINKWMQLKNTKAKKSYQTKSFNLSKKLQEALTTTKNSNSSVIAKFNANKKFYTDAYNRDKILIKMHVEEDIKNLKNEYNKKNSYYQLDFKNLIDNLNRNVDDYKYSKKLKIDYQVDRSFYFSEYNKLNLDIEKKIWNEKNKLVKNHLIEIKKQLPFQIYSSYKLSYLPLSVHLNKNLTDFKNNFFNKAKDLRSTLHNFKYWNWKEIFKTKLFEIPWYLYAVCLLIIGVAVYTKSLSAETMGSFAVLFAIAIIGGEVFNRLPLWKTYIGGGTMGVFFLAALLGTFHVFPTSITENVRMWFDKGGFLNLYINVLIVGSILTIPRKLILQSFTGFMGLLFAGVSLAIIIGYSFGEIIGLPLDHTVLKIMLPLLSDGNGGGVQPLSAMSSAYNYMSYKDYMSFALAVSSVSNVFVIIIAAFITAFLSKSPTLTGHGKIVKKEILTNEKKLIPNDRNIAAGLFIACVIYVLAKFIETYLEKLTGITINAFAWAVIISLVINLINVLPSSLKAGCDALNKFFTKQFTWLLMAGVGLTMTNLKVFASLFTNWKDILIILVMDISLVIGPALIAKIIKFYTLESMIAAGCCMGAQGGAGSLAVLGAAKRMELLPYSQITCRIGGGLVLIVAAPLFLAFTKALQFNSMLF